MFNYSSWKDYKNCEIKAKSKSETQIIIDEQDPYIEGLGIRASELKDDKNERLADNYFANIGNI